MSVIESARRTIPRIAQEVAGTVRPAGALALGAATIGIGFGLAFGWTEWIVAGALALLLVVMSIPFLFGARSLEVQLELPDQRIVAGDTAKARIIVRNKSHRFALPGRLDLPVGAELVEVGVPLLRPLQSTAHTIDLPPQPRGIVDVGPAGAIRSDPLGLFKREKTFDDVSQLYVHPHTQALPSMSAGLMRDLDGNPTRRLVDSDISFHAIREYAPGDSIRHVHWKSTAKTGQLMVRQYEESRRSRIAIVLGVATGEYSSAEEFELAVSCAASLSLRAVRDARDLHVIVGAAPPRTGNERVRAIRQLPSVSQRTLLDAFSGINRVPGALPVEDVCRRAAEVGPQLSIAVVLCGSALSLSRIRRAALGFSADTLVVGIVCNPQAHPRMQQWGSLTVITVGTLSDLSGLLVRGAAA